MGLKVIGAGFGRTGTVSTQAALEILLQGRCYHFEEMQVRPEHFEQWYQFGASGRQGMNWPALFHDYVACVDWPASNFYQELMQVYPEAKVILTYREPEAWYRSFAGSLELYFFMLKWFPFMRLIPRFKKFKVMLEQTCWHVFADLSSPASCQAAYLKHIAEVKAHVPPDKLLIFNPQQGWNPLCQFLKLEIPPTPFPHLNQSHRYKKRARRWLALESGKSLLPYVLGGILFAVLFFRVKKR